MLDVRGVACDNGVEGIIDMDVKDGDRTVEMDANKRE